MLRLPNTLAGPILASFLFSAAFVGADDFAVLPLVPPEEDSVEVGEEAIAQRYFEWALNAINAGRLGEADVFLTRAADYASVSSDLSYLLALVRLRNGASQNAVLYALRLALATDRWKSFSAQDARLLEARALLTVKNYSQAMRSLSYLGDDESAVELRLLALMGLPNINGFRRLMTDALQRYPRNTAIPRILFTYAAHQDKPGDADRALVETVTRRIDALLQNDPDLSYIAAPFIGDEDHARRILQSWRATRLPPLPIASIPVSLNLGIISEDEAIEELFSPEIDSDARILDREIITNVYNLLRTENSRAQFMRDLKIFWGTITEDSDHDGIIEARAVYRYGILTLYQNDANQDGIQDIMATFDGGNPASAELSPASLFNDQYDIKTFISWEKYPSVSEVTTTRFHFYFRPEDFYYPVLQFKNLCEPTGLLYPEQNNSVTPLNDQMLFSYAYHIESPSIEFEGGTAVIECSNGIVLTSREYLNGKVVSVSEYANGVLVMQSIDLDLDGRMETRRYFSVKADGSTALERIESDWDGDGLFEYRE
jgi:hypothetical protein